MAFPLGSSRAGVSVDYFVRSKIGPLPEKSALFYISIFLKRDSRQTANIERF
jgi:hypothetical protein